MGRRVAIVATGQTDHTSRRTDVYVAELAREAVDRCLASAGRSLADVDAIASEADAVAACVVARAGAVEGRRRSREEDPGWDRTRSSN